MSDRASIAKQPIKILLVEDSGNDHLFLQRQLAQAGAAQFELDWAQTFDQAEELVRQNRHDVYLLDANLGCGSGMDILRQIRDLGIQKPAILLTGKDRLELDDEAIELGAEDFLVKGQFDAKTLHRSIRYAIQRKKIEVEMRAASDRLSQVIATQQEIAACGLDLDTVMRVICERAQVLTSADGAVIETTEGGEMVYRAASGSAASLVGLRLKIDGSLSGLSVMTGEIQQCDDTDHDNRVDRAACAKARVRSMIVVPLKYRREPVGVLKVLSSKPRTFGQLDAQVLLLMAEFMAAALNGASEFQAKRELITELQQALANVKTLGGLLPICSHCKKIRDDKGYWNQIELFIRDHSNAKFTHGMCPECSREFYPQLFNKKEKV